MTYRNKTTGRGQNTRHNSQALAGPYKTQRSSVIRNS